MEFVARVCTIFAKRISCLSSECKKKMRLIKSRTFIEEGGRKVRTKLYGCPSSECDLRHLVITTFPKNHS